MARTVDPERYLARRLHIVDAALTCFAREGFDRTTTASICRAASIGSGTFFHYFPTKKAVLLAILELGAGETRGWFEAQVERTDAAGVVADYVEHCLDDYGDPRLSGFVRAVGAVTGDPEVASALELDERAQVDGLGPWLAAAQRAGAVRAGVPAERLATWVFLLLDGFVARLAGDEAFTVEGERDLLVETVARLLRP